MKIVPPYYTITPESITRERERLLDKARHDEAQALHNAKSERSVEIAKKLLMLGLPIDQIAEATDLRPEEIKELGCQS